MLSFVRISECRTIVDRLASMEAGTWSVLGSYKCVDLTAKNRFLMARVLCQDSVNSARLDRRLTSQSPAGCRVVTLTFHPDIHPDILTLTQDYLNPENDRVTLQNEFVRLDIERTLPLVDSERRMRDIFSIRLYTRRPVLDRLVPSKCIMFEL